MAPSVQTVLDIPAGTPGKVSVYRCAGTKEHRGEQYEILLSVTVTLASKCCRFIVAVVSTE